MKNFSIRPLTEADRPACCSLVLSVFDEFIAPHWSQEGIDTFHRTSPVEAEERFEDDCFILLGAETENQLVGVLMMSVDGHLYSLFVSGEFQRLGIGRRLLKEGVARVLEVNPSVSEITLTASPNSVEAHKAYGFMPAGAEFEKSGVRVTRMRVAVCDLTLG